MLRKAAKGHTVGGRCFGFDNVCSACGRVIPPGTVRCCREGHTDKRINEAQAAVIRRIFTLCAAGTGYTRIAKLLNAEGALTPTPARRRPAAWSPSSVLEVLRRPLYIGEIVYNTTQRRGADGAATYATRPESEWLRVERPDLRIVSENAWRAARERLTPIRARLDAASGGTVGRRRRDSDSPYVLSGFTRCAECGGSVGVLDRRQYGCIAYHKHGTTVCKNALKVSIATLESAVLAKLSRDVLRPAVVRPIIDGVLAELTRPDADRRSRPSCP
jgi:hypothetical protein